MNAIKLYRHPISGHAHRVENFLSILQLPYELIDVDLLSGEHNNPAFLRKNHFAQVPVMEDGNITLADSNAILTYLALTYDKNRIWLPQNPAAAAEVQRFLSIAAGPIVFGAAKARLINLFELPEDSAPSIGIAHDILSQLDRFLTSREWFATDLPTIADISLYSYIAHAPEGGIDLSDYKNIQTWITRVQHLPNFIPLVSSPVGLNAKSDSLASQAS